MHELSLCESIIQIMEENAETQGFHQVQRVQLEIGALSCVEIESLRFCFESAKQQSIADSAELEIITIPGKAACDGCSQIVAIETRYDACPECGHYPLTITQGEEMRIKSLEVQ